MTPHLLALPVVVLAGLSAVDLVTRPTLRRLALRNISRRKGEALLVVAGSLLGTAIICASFIVGDTLDASLRDLARTQYGPIDEAVTVSGPETLPEIEAALADPVAGADGGLSMVSATATVATVDGEDRAQPRAYLHEVDFGAARDFGGEPEATGFARAGATPRAGQAVVGEDLAEDLLLAAGDRVNVFVYGATLEVEVAGTLPRLGVAGFYPESGSRSPVLFVAPGTVAPLAERAGTTATPPRAQVLVSNAGGVFDGADSTPSVAEELLARVGGIAGVEVQELKADILEEAAAEGDSFTQLFSSIGSFSVIAGILLLVNIFVMLAEERKSELGMLRAVGVKRSHLVRSFALEGGIYAVTAAVMGTAVGVGVGRVIVFVTADLFDQGDFELALRFSVTSASLVTGALIGLSIALLTVWGTSIRIGRLNVICAIRDLPEPPRQRQRLRPVVLAGSGIVLGGVLLATGLSAGNGFPALAGPAIALFCTVTLLDRLAPRRVAVTVPCAAALAWGILAFVLFPDVFEGSDIPLFILQGIILVGAAVALVSANGDVSSHLSDRLSSSGRGLAARLGLAYPLAKRFRTALLLAMYSIVIFTLTFLAVISHIFGEQAPLLTAETGAGHEILVDSNPANPVTVDQLERQPDVVAATPLVRAFPRFGAEAVGDDPEPWPMAGFDARFLARGLPALSSREAGLADDEAAWRTVLNNPTRAIVSDFFLSDSEGPPEGLLDPGDAFTAVNETTGDVHRFTVAAVVASDFPFNGVFASRNFVVDFMGRSAVPSRHYVAVGPGADAGAVAERLTGELVANGVDADSFRAVIEDELAQQTGFFRLMEGFLSLGLVIGIAGLGVVMVRAVRERRRQIGMLRAMGFSRRVVRSAFLVEAAFIAAQGIVIGVALGVVTSWTLLTSSDIFGDSDLGFDVPWLALMVILLAPLLTSLLAAAVPAARAAAILPAAALRIAD